MIKICTPLFQLPAEQEQEQEQGISRILAIIAMRLDLIQNC